MAPDATPKGSAVRRRACAHDSERADGWLDDCCLRCGADGYWKLGTAVSLADARETMVHPSGKVLVGP
jgi:hypothetical protein